MTFEFEEIPTSPAERLAWVQARVADGRLTLTQGRKVLDYGVQIDELDREIRHRMREGVRFHRIAPHWRRLFNRIWFWLRNR